MTVSYVNQGLKTRISSVPKNPEFEHVIPKAFGISSTIGGASIKKIPHLGIWDSWEAELPLCGMTCQGIFRDANRERLQLKLNS
jgi:hypothetical protein